MTSTTTSPSTEEAQSQCEVSIAMPSPNQQKTTKLSLDEALRSDIVSLATAKHPTWFDEFSRKPRELIQRAIQLKSSRLSYLALYRSLDDLWSRLILLAAITLSTAAGIPLPLIGYIFGKIINSFPPDEDELRTRLIQLISVAIAYFCVTWGWSTCWGIVGERISKGLRERLLRKAMGMDMTYFDVESPDMSNILTEKTQAVQLGTSEKVGIFIMSLSYFVAAFTVGMILDKRLTGIIVAGVIPSMTLAVCVGTSASAKYSKRASELTSKASAIAESAIKGVQVVQAFGASEKLSTDHHALLRSSLRQGIRKSIAGAVMLGSIYFVAYSTNALAFWYGSQENTGSNGHEAGTIFAVVFLILDASFVVGQFGPFIQIFAVAAAAGEKIFEFLERPDSEINIYSDHGELVRPMDFEGDIHFDGIKFAYPARPHVPILNGFNLTLKAGSTIGMVGSSGSGKSTIASLLFRLYDPGSGRVTINGKSFRDLNLRSLRARMRLVEQDPKLFSGTIVENIAFGLVQDHGLTEMEVLQRSIEAAEEASCDFIFDLPLGMETPITGAGISELSGGQKQRLCLARALVSRPALLILDEYTSAMDATNEARVLANLRKSADRTNRTTIIIAHRLATIKEADEIIVMDGGAVTEIGTHHDLMSHEGLYSRLIEAQNFQKGDESESSSSANSISTTKSAGFSSDTDDGHDTMVLEESEATASSRLPLSKIMSRCLKLSRPEAPLVVTGIIASILSGGAIIGESIIFGNLVQTLSESDPSSFDERVRFLCLMFFILALTVLVAYSVSGTAFGIVSECLILRVRDISLRTILGQDLAWFSAGKRSPHSLMSTLNSDSGSLSGLSGVILGTIFSAITSTLCGIILAHVVAWKIAIVLLAAVPIMLLAGFFRLKVIAQTEERQRTCYNDAAAVASEACANIRTVAALGREKEVLRSYQRAIQKPYERSLKLTVLSSALLGVSLSLTYFVYALAYWW